MDYAADVIGYNAATSALDALAQPAIDAAAAQLTGARAWTSLECRVRALFTRTYICWSDSSRQRAAWLSLATLHAAVHCPSPATGALTLTPLPPLCPPADAAEGVAVSLISEGQLLAPSLEPAVRLYVESLAEQLIATTCTQASSGAVWVAGAGQMYSVRRAWHAWPRQGIGYSP